MHCVAGVGYIAARGADDEHKPSAMHLAVAVETQAELDKVRRERNKERDLMKSQIADLSRSVSGRQGRCP